MGTPESDEDVQLYLLAQLNSDYALEVMKRGRNPTPKGYYPVNESFLDEGMVDGDPTPLVARTALEHAKVELAARSDE
jgi:hypothetical protein